MKNINSSKQCPYCADFYATLTGEHIFPDFLGGKGKILACKGCNSTFGHSFEAKASRSLQGLHVSIASWGLPMKGPTNVWPDSHSFLGKPLDLIADGESINFALAKTVPQKNANGQLVSIYHPTLDAAKKAVQQLKKKGKQATVEIEKFEFDFSGARFIIALGSNEYRTATKMCVALATRMRDYSLSDTNIARASLQSNSSRFHCQPDFNRHYALEIMRPNLAHTIYVERKAMGVFGIVQFFGIIQLGVLLGENDQLASDAAICGYLDPLEGSEVIVDVEPKLNLDFAHTVEESAIQPGVQKWLAMFREAAIQRGAKSPPTIVGEATYGEA